MSAFSAGSVWWTLIDFGDGQGERKKYFVLVTDCENAGDQSFAAFTTSKGESRYGALAGGPSPCGSPNVPFFRIDAAQEACFPATTWVQFDNAGCQSRANLERLKKAGKADFIQALDPQRLRALLNCAKRSVDTPQRDIARIEQTLKALNQPKKAPPVPAPKVVTPQVDSEIRATRIRVDRYCSGCRAEFVTLAEISEENLVSILDGSMKPPANFIDTAKVAIELISDSGCGKCVHNLPRDERTLGQSS